MLFPSPTFHTKKKHSAATSLDWGAAECVFNMDLGILPQM